ncbi:hypothetical protein [Streptomyces beihaiensis]|uniref:DUF2336 domain-containing protein n=1 Tax=Streptomyces beihaiensis TaxID=2984495 RepID=A0ABT3U479_9ACTN|nr:hypothetical protein [Streptomyces beihaiensis]MCX3063451.1 hypothetical protein [Streptomyces beihaiensis]
MTATTATTVTDTLQNRAEVLKTGQALGIEPERLDFLTALPAADVRRFREQAVAALFDGAPEMLDRIAAATKLVPAGIAAAISQKALGPRLAAAVAGRLDPARAADIIEKLPVAFTARACAHLDPRRIAGIVDRLDEGLVVRIAVDLAQQGDHLTMGRFVGYLRDSALTRILPQVDDAAVLRTGFLVDRPEQLGRIVALMGEERLGSVIAAASGERLWPEALAVAGMVTGEQRTRIAELAADQPREGLEALVATVAEQDLWESLLPLVALLDDARRRTVAALPSLRDDDLLADVVRAVVATGLWGEFLPLVEVLPAESRAVVAEAAGALPEDDLDALAREVDKRDLWDVVLPLVELMSDEAKQRVFALPTFRDAGA